MKSFLHNKISGFYFILLLLTISNNSFSQKNSKKPVDEIKSKVVIVDSPVKTKADTTTHLHDTDKDGIIDSLDKCPTEKGVIQYDGCPHPDSDNDGLTDDLDECPTVAGAIKYKGCPAGDADGDKINDDEDKCPDVPGLARFDGCLTKDTDADGVNDDDDKCIDVAGSSSNFGCPDTRQYRKFLKKQEGKKKSANPSSSPVKN